MENAIKMSNIQRMRVPIELKQMQESVTTHGIKCTTNPPESDDFSNLIAIIPGPKNSPYEAGKFHLNITLSETYPFTPPIVTFQTPVYHPNIDNAGHICLDILRIPPGGSYNPAITLESILLSIQLLLATPNPHDPLNAVASDLCISDRDKFNSKAEEFTKMHALSE